MNETWLSRTEMMLGEDALTKLKKSKVAVFDYNTTRSSQSQHIF